MKRLLNPLFFVLALLLVLEELLWDWTKAQLKRLSALPFVAAVERRLRNLGPWGSLAVMALPAAVLFPFKLAALWALSHGHPMLGVLVLIAAKLAGTGCAAYLFDLVRDNARKLAWFDRFYSAVMGLLKRAKAWLVAQPACLAAKALTARFKAALTRRSAFSRKLRAAKCLARKS